MKTPFQKSIQKKLHENSVLIKVTLPFFRDEFIEDLVLNPANYRFSIENETLELFLKLNNPEADYQTYCAAITKYLRVNYFVRVTPADFQSIEACHLFHCTCPCLATTRIVDTEKLLEYVLPFNDPEALVA